MHSSAAQPSFDSSVVYILDDDDTMLWTLRTIVESIRVKVVTYQNAQDFLSQYRASPTECLISDVRMPGMSGLELQRQLTSIGVPPPIIFVTGHSEVSAAVEAMRGGAFDFIEKPVNGHLLIEKVQNALLHSRDLHKARMQDSARQARLSLLTPKEREIIELVVEGKSSKEIANQLDISVRTVENHRARVMEKLHVTSAIELVRLFA